MIISEMPQGARPREKMIRYGATALSNEELVAILLRTGTREKTAIKLAEELLTMDADGMLYLAECSIEEMMEIKGMGQSKACQITAAIEIGKRIATVPRNYRKKIKSTEDVVDIFMEKMRYYKKEFFNVLLVNAKGELIAEENIAVGDLSSSIVHPRESFAPAVKRSAAAVIFIHNHPSGDPAPSREDIQVTKRLTEAGEIIGIKVLDHVIIGDGRYTSFKAKGLI